MTPAAPEFDFKVVWEPHPGSQALALDSRCHITFYHGTRGPGKTDCQLMRFRRNVGVGYGRFWRGIIFDVEYKNLDDLVSKSLRWFPEFNDGAKWLSSNSQYKWVWPGGEELLFRAAADERDYYSYHGHEYPFIGWNEITKYPNSKLFDRMLSTNRSSFKSDDPDLPPIPLEVFLTGNPHGAGHNWVKKRFIDPAPNGVPVKREVEVEIPGQRGKFVKVVKTQVSLFGSWVENPRLTPEYIATLMGEKDEAARKAWLSGDWNIVAGGALDDVWNPRIHVLPRFIIPKQWTIYRSFDWGSTHPFSVGWHAVANGEEAEIVINGEAYTWCPPAGSSICCGEWYGCKIGPDGTENEGLKMSVADIAEGIRDREKLWLEDGWFEAKPVPGPADNQIWSVDRVDQETIADSFSKHGVEWIHSNKSPGSRIHGLQLMRDRLHAAVHRPEDPGLYFQNHCVNHIATIPVLPRDPKKPDDVDTKAEDHPYDDTRYLTLHIDKRPASGLTARFN